MKIDAEAHITHPADLTFRTFRDHSPDVADGMPNITKVDVLERDVDGEVLRQVMVWHASASVPTVARPFVPADKMRWTDTSTWFTDGLWCEWRIETAFLTDRVDCTGRTTFEPRSDETTRMAMQLDLNLDLDRLPGVPSLVSKRARGPVEKFVVGVLRDNLVETATFLQKYLDETSH